MKMPLAVLEPSCLSLDSTTGPADYVDWILAWSDLLGRDPVQVAISERACDELFKNDCYPTVPRLTKYLSDVEEFDAQTVSRAIDRLLRSTPSLEQISGLSDYLADAVSCLPLPPCANEATWSNARNHACIHAALINELTSNTQSAVLVGKRVGDSEARVSATFYDTIPEHFFSNQSFPVQFNGTIKTRSSPARIYELIDAADAWLNSATASQFETSIRLFLAQTKSDSVREFRVNSKFTNNIGKGDRHAFARRVLAAVADTIFKRALNQTHALRQSAAPTAPQLERAVDRAFRRDIDYEFHLHYWECGDGSVEFGCIVSHNVFFIPS